LAVVLEVRSLFEFGIWVAQSACQLFALFEGPQLDSAVAGRRSQHARMIWYESQAEMGQEFLELF